MSVKYDRPVVIPLGTLAAGAAKPGGQSGTCNSGAHNTAGICSNGSQALAGMCHNGGQGGN